MSAKRPAPPPTIRERTQNFLLYGFALSILIHLIIGPFVKFNRTPEAPEKVETVKIDRMPTPPPTPPPTPKPTPTPPPTPPPTQPPKATPPPQQQAIKINTLKTNSHSGGPSEAGNTHTAGSTNGAPAGVPNGTASAPPPTEPPATPPPPTPPPTPSCAVPNADAKTIQAAEPETPALAQQQGITGEVVVRVTLDENSHLVAATVTKTASPLLNNAAIQAAKQSTFKTRIQDCKPVSDSYNFIVDFQSQ